MQVEITDLSDFDWGIVDGIRRAGLSISENAELLGFYTEWCKKIIYIYTYIQWAAVLQLEMACW